MLSKKTKLNTSHLKQTKNAAPFEGINNSSFNGVNNKCFADRTHGNYFGSLLT
jgi:hypothetical protein